MWSFEFLSELVKYDEDRPCYIGLEGRLLSIECIHEIIEYKNVILIESSHDKKTMTVGDIRKLLGQFEYKMIYSSEPGSLCLLKIMELCIENGKLIIGD